MYKAEISELKGGPYYSDMLSTYTIYSLVNLDNFKRYIGRTQNPKVRIKQHFVDIKRHKHSNKLLNKDSGCRFSIEILEEGISFDERTNKERAYILLHRTYDEEFGYNANDPCIKHFVEERRKMPKVFLTDEDMTCHRLASWVLGEKKRLNLNDTALAYKRGISQSAMSRKIRLESFDFKDFVFFVKEFQPDDKTLRYIVGQ